MSFARGYLDILRSGWRASPGRMALSFLILLSTYVSQPLLALVLRQVTNAVVAHDVASATTAALFLPVMALVNSTGNRLAQVVWVELSNLQLIDFAHQVGTLAQGSPGLEHLERPDYADRVAMLRHEGNPLIQAINQSLTALSLLAQFGITIGLLAFVQPVLLLLLVGGVPPMLLGRAAWARLERGRLAAADRSRQAAHLLDLALRADSAKEVRVFGLQRELSQRLRAARADVYRLIAKERTAALLLTIVGQAIFALCYSAGLLLVVREAISGHQSVGNVVLVVTLAAQVNGLVFRAVGLAQFLQRSVAAFGRLAWLHRLVAELYPAPTRPELTPPPVLRRGIDFEDVGFRYPGTGHIVLSGVNLHLDAGTTVALVGENGAGKSTLVKLLCRFYQPSQGRVLVDGADLADLSLSQWRERVSAGFQDFLRLEFPLGQSVGAGDLSHLDDTEAVGRALARADAVELAQSLPRGLATRLGRSYPDGVELSGGQWQKIALARAMMRPQPLLLILDEPTSALDAHAEFALFERYKAVAGEMARANGGIALFVSHRFSTVRMADLIVVVHGGRVAEQGSHHELMALGGIYAELFSLQAAAFR